jgi:DNA-binding SARP family transcriptional activator
VFEISVLGPLKVRRNGVDLKVPSGKTSELLVRLALDAGTVVRTDRLLEDLWGDAAVTTRRNTLQSKVTMLRRALGDPSLLAGADGGYVLAVDPSGVDALVVRGQLSTASHLLDAGDDRAAADVCASTLRMYHAEVLPAAGDGEWVAPHRALLEEARLELLESGLSARSRLGDGDLVTELDAAVATYPLHEGLWELLVTALYRAGRQADALATYQSVRAHLADELGLDPGPRLQQLEQRILAHDPALGGSTPQRAGDLSAGNLPSLSAELVGREADVADLLDLLGHRRLIEIVGPGGVGKTAVAVAAGRRWASSSTDAVWLARLETAATADDIVDTVIAALPRHRR